MFFFGILILSLAAIVVSENRHSPVTINRISLNSETPGTMYCDVDFRGSSVAQGCEYTFSIEGLPLFVPFEQVLVVQKDDQTVQLGPIPINSADTAGHDVDRDLTPLELRARQHIGLRDVQHVVSRIALISVVARVVQRADDAQPAVELLDLALRHDVAKQGVVLAHVVDERLSMLAECR